MTDKPKRNCLTVKMREFIIKQKKDNKRSVREIVGDFHFRYGMETSRMAVQRTLNNRKRYKEVLEGQSSANVKRKR